MVFQIFLAVEPFLPIKTLTGNPTSQTDKGRTALVGGVVKLSWPTTHPHLWKPPQEPLGSCSLGPSLHRAPH